MLAGLAGITATAEWPGLVALVLAAFGLGLGTHNVHLIARTMAGLGDATVAASVGPAITVVYGAHLVPMAVVFMFRFVGLRPAPGKDQPASRFSRSRSSAPKHSRCGVDPPSLRRVSTWLTEYSGRPPVR